MRTIPERLARDVLLIAVTLCAVLPFLQLSPRRAWWQEPAVVFAAVALACVSLIHGELHPERADGWAAVRAHRFAPTVIGLLGASALLFPTFGGWWILWPLLGINLVLLPWAFIARVRCVALCVSSALALGATVLHDGAAWTLAPIGIAWLLLPSLDRLAEARLRLPWRTTPPVLLAPLVSTGVLFAVGAAVFGVATLLLPASTRAFEVVNLLAPGGGARAATGTPEVPALETFALLAAIVGVLFFVTRLADTPSANRAVAEEKTGVMTAGVEAPLVTGEAQLARWPKGPRRALVRAYLEHRRRLGARGAAAPGVTPRQHAAGISGALPESLRDAPAHLADRFARARWASPRVNDDDVAEAAREAARIEEGLRQ